MRRAIGFMVLAALFFTALSSLIRYMDHLPTFELVFFRSIGSVLCCALWLKRYKIAARGNNPKWLLLRGLVGLISMALFFKAIQIMPLGSAVGLRYLAPFFAAVMAMVFLNEKMRPLQWIFFVSAFLGVLLVKGFDPRISTLGLFIILSSAFFTGLVYVIIRKLGESENPVVIVTYFMVTCSSVGLILAIPTWVHPVGIEWLVVSAMGIIGFTAQVLMTKAIQLAEAHIITPFKYIEVVGTVWVGWLIFGEYQTKWALLGIAIIIVSLLLNLWAAQPKTKVVAKEN